MDGIRKVFLGFGVAAAVTTAGFAQEKKQDNQKALHDDINGTWSGMTRLEAGVYNSISFEAGFYDSISFDIQQNGSVLSGELLMIKYRKDYPTPSRIYFQVQGNHVDDRIELYSAGVIDEEWREKDRPDKDTEPFRYMRLEATIQEKGDEAIIGGAYFYRQMPQAANVKDLLMGQMEINFRRGTFEEIAKRDAEKEARRQEKIRLQQEARIKKQKRGREVADSIANHVSALRGIEYILVQNSAKPSPEWGEQHNTGSAASRLWPALVAWEQHRQKENDKHNPHFDALLFHEGSAEILDISELERLAEFMKTHPGVQVRITGSTEPRGTPKMLKELSVKRAEAAETILELLGIDPHRVETVGIGSANRLPPGKFDPALNRRAEIDIIEAPVLKTKSLGP